MERRRRLQHPAYTAMPHRLFQQRSLLHAPWVQTAQRTNDVGNAMLAARARGSDTRMRKNRVNVHGVKACHMAIQPARQRRGVTEPLAPFALKEDRRHSLIVNSPAKLNAQ